ncbi:hypothetical protein D3C73_1531250 [compost metagenome]
MRHDQLQLILHNGLDFHIGMADLRLNQAEIKLMLRNFFHNLRCVHDLQHNRNIRISFAEWGQQPGQHVLTNR